MTETPNPTVCSRCDKVIPVHQVAHIIGGGKVQCTECYQFVTGAPPDQRADTGEKNKLGSLATFGGSDNTVDIARGCAWALLQVLGWPIAIMLIVGGLPGAANNNDDGALLIAGLLLILILRQK